MLKDIVGIFSSLVKTAARNAAASPKTTATGIAGIGAGISLLMAGPQTTTDTATALSLIVGGIGLVLADDINDKTQ